MFAFLINVSVISSRLRSDSIYLGKQDTRDIALGVNSDKIIWKLHSFSKKQQTQQEMKEKREQARQAKRIFLIMQLSSNNV